MKKRSSVLPVAALVLTACGEVPDSASEAQRPQQAENGVFRPYLNAIERAEGVQDVLQQRSDRQRRALEGSND